MAVMLQAVEATTPLPAESVPPCGTFYSALHANWPPLPANINNFPVWNLGDNVWLLDDLEPPQMQMRAMSMATFGLGWNNGGDDLPAYTFDANSLWLEITNVANGLAYLNLHNTTNQVYSIWSTTNLLTPFSGWQVETELWPTRDQTNVLPLTVDNSNRQNLFMRAEDWTGVTENGNTTPDTRALTRLRKAMNLRATW